MTARAEADVKAAAIGAAEEAIATAGLARAAAATELAGADAGLAEARAAVAALDSELAALDRSLSASGRDGGGVLAQMRVQPGYEAALAAALGDDLAAPLLDAADEGARGWSASVVHTGLAPKPDHPERGEGLSLSSNDQERKGQPFDKLRVVGKGEVKFEPASMPDGTVALLTLVDAPPPIPDCRS